MTKPTSGDAGHTPVAWEYFADSHDVTDHLGIWLNQMGARGWELIQAPASGLTRMFYFKRRKATGE